MASKSWLNDPVLFVAVVKELWGRRSEGLKYEIANLRTELDRMKPKAPQPYITSVELLPLETKPTPVGTELVAPAERLPAIEEAPIDIERAQLVTLLGAINELTKINEKLSKEEFEGAVDPRVLSATDSLKWLDLVEDPPHKPWISAYFINDGDATVEIGVNHPELKRHQIKKSETLTIDQSHASERIRRLFYICASGTASVRVVGQY